MEESYILGVLSSGVSVWRCSTAHLFLSSQRAVLKFAHYTGGNPIAGRFTPGTFTNQIQKAFREPRLLVVTDPSTDHQVCVYVPCLCVYVLVIVLLFLRL